MAAISRFTVTRNDRLGSFEVATKVSHWNITYISLLNLFMLYLYYLNYVFSTSIQIVNALMRVYLLEYHVGNVYGYSVTVWFV
jgi:hypothetical protein